jgi:hypothetical protein
MSRVFQRGEGRCNAYMVRLDVLNLDFWSDLSVGGQFSILDGSGILEGESVVLDLVMKLLHLRC